MEEEIMLKILCKIENLVDKNRFIEARKIIKQEIENLKGITEQKCKKIKIRKDYCKICTNLYCNMNCNIKVREK